MDRGGTADQQHWIRYTISSELRGDDSAEEIPRSAGRSCPGSARHPYRATRDRSGRMRGRRFDGLTGNGHLQQRHLHAEPVSRRTADEPWDVEVVSALMSTSEARARIRAGFDMARNGRRTLPVALSRRDVKLHVYGRVSGQSGARDNRELAHHTTCPTRPRPSRMPLRRASPSPALSPAIPNGT